MRAVPPELYTVTRRLVPLAPVAPVINCRMRDLTGFQNPAVELVCFNTVVASLHDWEMHEFQGHTPTYSHHTVLLVVT